MPVSSKPVALVGCGPLGTRLGRRLLRAGLAVAVHDRDRHAADPLLEAGARWADDATALVSGCSVLVSALPDAEAAEAFHLGPRGAWPAAARGTIHLEASTVGPACVRRLAEAARSLGIDFLDVPFSRGRPRSEGPDLSAFVAGDANVLDRAKPVLEVIADQVLYVGPVGQGQVAKLVNNLVALGEAVLLGEALALGVKAGADLDLLRSALSAGTAQSRTLDDLFPTTVFSGDFRPGLRLLLVEKDLRLAAELAAACEVDLLLLGPVRARFQRAIERGWGEETAHAVVKLSEEETGVELRSPVLMALRRAACPLEG